MQAFILAAGLGTRLKPLTDSCPKALVEVQGEPLIKIAIEKLVNQGISRIVVNVHHFADLLCQYIQSRDWGVPVIISDERECLLDTGAGLKHAEPLFVPNEPILIYNVDILSRIDLCKVLKQHTDSMNLATLVVSDRSTSRYLLFNQEKQLIGWHNRNTDEYLWSSAQTDSYHELAFDGIAIVEPALLDLLPQADKPYSIIPCYLNIAKQHRISYFSLDKENWLDVGKPETLKQAQSWKLF